MRPSAATGLTCCLLLPLPTATCAATRTPPADAAQWGDILENLRGLSSASGNPPGSCGSLPRNPNSVSATDWIPEFLGRFGSGRSDYDATGAAGAAAGGGAAAAAAGGASNGGTEAAAAGGAGGAADGAAAAAAAGRKGNKRERSRTGQAPTAEQLAQLQSMCAEGGPSGLRSLSHAAGHHDSFNRHFPLARHSSQTPGVHQVRCACAC
jgi:hypothetical protein